MKTTRELLIERMGNDINIFSPKGVDIMVEIIEEIAEQKVKNCNKPQVSKCEDFEREALLLAFLDWIHECQQLNEDRKYQVDCFLKSKQ